MDYGFEFVKDNGLCSEEAYPYQAKDTGECQTCDSLVKISDYYDVPNNNETALQLNVFKQPVSVSIEADQTSFQFYSSGVFTGDCGTNLDHGVLLVGWGEENGNKYWKVKNSWGEDWGDDGYILLERDISSPEGKCGIAMDASVPVY